MRTLSFGILILVLMLGPSRNADAQSWIKRIGKTLARKTLLKRAPTTQSTTGRVRIDVLGGVSSAPSTVAETFPKQRSLAISGVPFRGPFAQSLMDPATNPVLARVAFQASLNPGAVLDQELSQIVGVAKIENASFLDRGSSNRGVSYRHAANSVDCAPDFGGSYLLNGDRVEYFVAPRDELIEMAFSQDLGNVWYRLRDDTAALVRPENLLAIALAGGGALALRGEADESVRRYTARSPKRWGSGTDFFGEIGDVGVQVPVLLGMYYLSLRNQDEELHDFSTTMLSAFTINGLSTLAIKVAAQTDRPSDDYNNGEYGFPSYHASSSFTIASVVDEYYGAEYGLPAYVVAGLIGWGRIDSRDHDLSDVLFGSALGYIIGKSVARHHLQGDSRVQILPWFEPSNGSAGISFSRGF